MMQQLQPKTIAENGSEIIYDYDATGDLLEVIFRRGEATCAVELTESIILRFDWATNEPLSLSFISYSKLIQPTELGEPHFQLLTDEWPDEVYHKVITMLKARPLTDLLVVSSYAPAHGKQWVPTAAIRQPQLRALAA